METEKVSRQVKRAAIRALFRKLVTKKERRLLSKVKVGGLKMAIMAEVIESARNGNKPTT